MTDSAPNDPLSRLPVDLLTDVLLPVFTPTSLINLASTCRTWHAFLTQPGGPCEILWKKRTAADFHFPTGASGRRSGFCQLYGRLARSSAYVWGQNENGRLALPAASFRLPTSLRSRLINGGISIPTRLELPSPPVSLVAGGWSFHALTASGEIVSWGTLDAGNATGIESSPLHYPGRILRPQVLPQSEDIGEAVQLEAGRRHIVALGHDGKVWEFQSFGRAVEVRDETGRWGTVAGAGTLSATGVKAVQAGWDYSAVLTNAGDVYVWWQQGSALLDRKAAEAGERDLASFSTQGVAFPLEIDTLRLPPLPPSPSHPEDKIELIACGDNFLIALTSASQLYHLNLSPVPDPARPLGHQGARDDPEDSPVRSRASRARLEAEFVAGRRGWRRMSRFCDMEEVGQLDAFRETGIAPGTRITHVSAQFHSFAAYSVPSTSDPAGSIVLLGDNERDEGTIPQVIPELQGLGVIKVSHGDYHNIALTSNGRLYSWGAYSAGALGLGHPQLSNTPLSAPHPPAGPSSADQPGQVGVLPFPPPQQQPPALFPGFLPPRALPRPPPPPDRVDKPTRVRFHSESADGSAAGTNTSGKFVYAVAAAGWHSGCLAVDLDADSSPAAAAAEEEPMIRLPRSEGEEAAEEMRRLAGEAQDESANGERSWMGRLGRNLRVGFAGRGGVAAGAAGGAAGGGSVMRTGGGSGGVPRREA
ncbi:hypothetical protein JCM6882_007502 [Rhodosporidiobolus microsporus]